MLTLLSGVGAGVDVEVGIGIGVGIGVGIGDDEDVGISKPPPTKPAGTSQPVATAAKMPKTAHPRAKLLISLTATPP